MLEGSAQASPSPVLMIAVVVVLGGLDLVGSVLAKQWTGGGGAWWFVAGAMSFLLLFGVYALSLRYAELSTVSFGWVITLQVGILLVERLHYGVELPSGKWVAIAAIMLLQAYLILGPSASQRTEPTRRPPGIVAATEVP